jgi:hypothetical protein
MNDCPNSPFDGSGVSTNSSEYFPANVTSSSNPAEITYSLYGDLADAQEALGTNSTSICYSQSAPFVQADGTTSPFDAALNQYEGVPPQCPESATVTLPCWTNVSYTPTDGESPSEWSIQINTDIDPGQGKH